MGWRRKREEDKNKTETENKRKREDIAQEIRHIQNIKLKMPRIELKTPQKSSNPLHLPPPIPNCTKKTGEKMKRGARTSTIWRKI